MPGTREGQPAINRLLGTSTCARRNRSAQHIRGQTKRQAPRHLPRKKRCRGGAAISLLSYHKRFPSSLPAHQCHYANLNCLPLSILQLHYYSHLQISLIPLLITTIISTTIISTIIVSTTSFPHARSLLETGMSISRHRIQILTDVRNPAAGQ
jgi:hypothetical protein